MKRYIERRLKNIQTTDLGQSLFYNDIFTWENVKKRKNDHMGQFFRRKRVKLLLQKHESLLLKWIQFTETV